MADTMQSPVTMYDIRSDKSEASLLKMLKDGLSREPKTMPTLLLYNEKGLRLFEEITYLDEYYLTNAEIDALTKHADAIAEHVPSGARVIELGSGNLRKVNILLQAFERAAKVIDYFALDLSKPELERTFEQLNTAAFKYVTFNAFHGTYDDGLAWLADPAHQDKVNMIMSLGSSIGNFDRQDAAKFLLGFSRVMKPHDLFLIGIDGSSDGDRIFKAYNDSHGVTERFDRNGLDHANAILGYEAFKHDEWAVRGDYVREENAHKASYVALKDVDIAGIPIKKGEIIPFEQSVKFVESACDSLWHDSGLVEKAVFTNTDGNQKIYILRQTGVKFQTKPEKYAATTTPSVDDWNQLWAAWDVVTRSMVPRQELMEKPIKLRNNLIFYLGHIPTFADIHYTKATGESATEPKYYSQIFERGIDPDVDDPTMCHAHSEIPDEWPALQEILDYQLHVRSRISQSIESGRIHENRKLARGLTLAYEHEAMHLETFLYMLLQSDKVLPPPGHTRPDFAKMAEQAMARHEVNQWHQIPSSQVAMGANDSEDNKGPDRYYLWDNERPARMVSVESFEAQSRPISNGEYAKFLEDTHNTELPASWDNENIGVNGFSNGNNGVQDGSAHSSGAGAPTRNFLLGKCVKTVWGLVPLKFALEWPVMASYDELLAYAQWFGGRIPTAEELKSIYNYVEQKQAAENTSSTLVPAVNGHLSNDGVEETPPQQGLSVVAGSSASPTTNPRDLFVSLDGANVGFQHWHPVPVTGEGGRLRGQADTGGMWEWTSSVFAAHEGFSAMELYPGYSADFFDGKHNICLGGGWATVPRIAGRKSFVNWYQRNYPYVWCTARLVRDVASSESRM